MMELARGSLMRRSSVNWIKWPKTPQTKIGKAEKPWNGERRLSAKDDTLGEHPKRKTNGCDNLKPGVEVTSSETAGPEVTFSIPAINDPPDIEVAEETLSPESQKIQTRVEVEEQRKSSENIRRSPKDGPLPETGPKITEQSTTAQSSRFMNQNQLMKRLKLKSPWPNPELSLGTKCNPLGGNECWVAIGPAQELFTQVANKITELLDNRVYELEEGEPVAGNILTFGMYMMGSRPNNARPTIIFTCQSVNLRRRAIKFVKQSSILKEHPKILLAQSSTCPLAAGKGHLRLLAASHRKHSAKWDSSVSPRDITSRSSSNSRLSTSQLAAAIAAPIGFTVLLLLAFFIFLLWRRRKFITSASQHRMEEAETLDNRRWVANWLSNSSPAATGKAPSSSMSSEPISDMYSNVSPLNQSPSSSQQQHAPKANINSPSDLQHPLPSAEIDSILAGHTRVSGIGHLPTLYEMTTISSGSPSTTMSPTALAQTTKEPQRYSEQGTSIKNLVENTGETRLDSDKQSSSLKLHDIHHRVIPIKFGEHSRATVGGFINCTERYFGLTVGHSMNSVFITNYVIGSNSDEDDFAFDIEDQEESETEFVDVDISSRASLSSASSRLQYISTTSTSSQSENVRDSKNLSLVGRFEKPQSNNPDCILVDPSQIYASSIVGTDLGLDWALIRLDDIGLSEFQAHTPPQALQARLNVAVKPPDNNRVAVVRGCSGVANGSVLSSTTMMKLSPHSRFQEVWSVELDSPSLEGDSGSWVVDTNSGDLYGHIVAGVLGSNTVYIVPAYKAIANIEWILGAKVQIVKF